MQKLKLVTKHNQNAVVDATGTIMQYEFTLYRLTMNLYVQPFRSNYGLLQGLVNIDAYGIIVRHALQQDGLLIIEEFDKGPLSARQFEVNGLLSALCLMEDPNLQKINELVARYQLLWSTNKWGSPFGKVAERSLIDKYRKDCSARSQASSHLAHNQLHTLKND